MPSEPDVLHDSLDKFKIQDGQYHFPYHYVAHFDDHGGVSQVRRLSWGLEYLCYLSHIQELAYSLTPSSVLDVGCGDGRFIGMLEGEIDRRVGVDLSERAIRFAQAFHPDVDFRAIDACELNETFDLVVAIEVLEHVPDEQMDKFLRTLAERTNIGGHVIISVPTTVIPPQNKHYRHYDLRVLQKQLASSGVQLRIINVDYVFKLSFLMKLYLRLSQNRLWTIEFRSLQRMMWDYAWSKLRKASEKDGNRLVVILQKVQEIN